MGIAWKHAISAFDRTCMQGWEAAPWFARINGRGHQPGRGMADQRLLRPIPASPSAAIRPPLDCWRGRSRPVSYFSRHRCGQRRQDRRDAHKHRCRSAADSDSIFGRARKTGLSSVQVNKVQRRSWGGGVGWIPHERLAIGVWKVAPSSGQVRSGAGVSAAAVGVAFTAPRDVAYLGARTEARAARRHVDGIAARFSSRRRGRKNGRHAGDCATSFPWRLVPPRMRFIASLPQPAVRSDVSAYCNSRHPDIQRRVFESKLPSRSHSGPSRARSTFETHTATQCRFHLVPPPRPRGHWNYNFQFFQTEGLAGSSTSNNSAPAFPTASKRLVHPSTCSCCTAQDLESSVIARIRRNSVSCNVDIRF